MPINPKPQSHIQEKVQTAAICCSKSDCTWTLGGSGNACKVVDKY